MTASEWGPIWWNTPIDAELAKADKGGRKGAAEDSIEDPEVRKTTRRAQGGDGGGEGERLD